MGEGACPGCGLACAPGTGAGVGLLFGSEAGGPAAGASCGRGKIGGAGPATGPVTGGGTGGGPTVGGAPPLPGTPGALAVVDGIVATQPRATAMTGTVMHIATSLKPGLSEIVFISPTFR